VVIKPYCIAGGVWQESSEINALRIRQKTTGPTGDGEGDGEYILDIVSIKIGFL
jgi:hypothetical protein